MKPTRRQRKQQKEATARRLVHAALVARAKARRKRTITGDDVKTIDDLAKLLGLTSYEKLSDLNQDAFAEAGSYAYKAALREADEDEDEDAESVAAAASMKAEEAAETDLYHQWYNAVEYVADNLFEEHGLELVPRPRNKTDKYPYEFRIAPTTTWHKAAAKILRTLNGVGFPGSFDTLQDFLESGPYTSRSAVLSHLGYVKMHPEVYGTSSPQRMFESHMR